MAIHSDARFFAVDELLGMMDARRGPWVRKLEENTVKVKLTATMSFEG